MPLLAADPVTVLPEQREALERLVRTHSTPQQLALRAHIIVRAADGMGVRASARELGVWPKTVRYWRKRWREAAGGLTAMSGFQPRARSMPFSIATAWSSVAAGRATARAARRCPRVPRPTICGAPTSRVSSSSATGATATR